MEIKSTTRVDYTVTLDQDEVNKIVEEIEKLDEYTFSNLRLLLRALRFERNDHH